MTLPIAHHRCSCLGQKCCWYWTSRQRLEAGFWFALRVGGELTTNQTQLSSMSSDALRASEGASATPRMQSWRSCRQSHLYKARHPRHRSASSLIPKGERRATTSALLSLHTSQYSDLLCCLCSDWGSAYKLDMYDWVCRYIHINFHVQVLSSYIYTIYKYMNIYI